MDRMVKLLSEGEGFGDGKTMSDAALDSWIRSQPDFQIKSLTHLKNMEVDSVTPLGGGVVKIRVAPAESEVGGFDIQVPANIADDILNNTTNGAKFSDISKLKFNSSTNTYRTPAETPGFLASMSQSIQNGWNTLVNWNTDPNTRYMAWGIEAALAAGVGYGVWYLYNKYKKNGEITEEDKKIAEKMEAANKLKFFV